MTEWNELGKPTLMAKWLQMHAFFLLQKASAHLVRRLRSTPIPCRVIRPSCCLVWEYSLQSFLSGVLAASCVRDVWGKSSKCCLRFSNDRQIVISINPLSVFSKELFDNGVCRTGNTWQDSSPTQIPTLKMKKTETLSIIIPGTGADSLPWKAISPPGYVMGDVLQHLPKRPPRSCVVLKTNRHWKFWLRHKHPRAPGTSLRLALCGVMWALWHPALPLLFFPCVCVMDEVQWGSSPTTAKRRVIPIQPAGPHQVPQSLPRAVASLRKRGRGILGEGSS